MAWANLALTYDEQGLREPAIQAMTRAAEISADLRYLDPLVSWLLTAGRLQEALDFATLAVRFHPTHGMAHLLRAAALAPAAKIKGGQAREALRLHAVPKCRMGMVWSVSDAARISASTGA